MTITQMTHVLGARSKALLVKPILHVLNWTRVYITPSQPQNSPQRQHSPSMHSVRVITLRRAAILRSQPRDLGLTSSTACLLLPHKPNPRPSPNPPSHRSDPSARCRQYHSKHVGRVCAPLPPQVFRQRR